VPTLTDHTPFLNTVLADPTSDAPKLVYADWLEERGECDRAEFIRTQIELASHSECPECGGTGGVPTGMVARMECPRLSALRRRERELLTDGSAADWCGLPYEDHGRVHDGRAGEFLFRIDGCEVIGEFRRGFIDEIHCTTAAWVGGPCLRCGGSKIEQRVTYDDYETLACGACAGTGHTPGIAAAVCAAAPVLAVTLTDKKPARNGSLRRWYTPGGFSRASEIPLELWQRMVVDPQSSTSVDYPTDDAANLALQRAAVDLGRQLAGLPAIRWPKEGTR